MIEPIAICRKCEGTSDTCECDEPCWRDSDYDAVDDSDEIID